MLNSFLQPKGRKSLMFFYQEFYHEGNCEYHNKLVEVMYTYGGNKIFFTSLLECLASSYFFQYNFKTIS